MTSDPMTAAITGPEFRHTEESFAEATRPVLEAFVKAADPYLKKVADEVYERLLYGVQEHLIQNADWNLAWEIRRAQEVDGRNAKLSADNAGLLLRVEALEQGLRAFVEWHDKAGPSTDEATDYLNDDGWEDVARIADEARTLLGDSNER